MDYEQIKIGNIEAFFAGPSLDVGPMPALIYLSISGQDSLSLDPFNQPVVYLLTHYKMRVFSLTIPGHEPPLDPQNAIAVWAEDFSRGSDPLTPFIEQIGEFAKLLMGKGIASSVGIAGLSRGGFLALHAAAKLEALQHVLGFAPMSRLGLSKEFSLIANEARIQYFDLKNLSSQLINKSIRLYIGNRDVRVSTSACFSFVEAVAEEAFQNRIRSPQIELIVTPSIGHQGHGTSKPIFEQGSMWMANQLGSPSHGKE
jgi:hypothetical protein